MLQSWKRELQVPLLGRMWVCDPIFFTRKGDNFIGNFLPSQIPEVSPLSRATGTLNMPMADAQGWEQNASVVPEDQTLVVGWLLLSLKLAFTVFP